jgi:hypothetical protein
MIRIWLLAFVVALSGVFTSIAPAYADEQGYVRCAREKVRDANAQGAPVNLRAIRAVCRQIHGEDVEYKPPGRITGGANNEGSGRVSAFCEDYAKEAAAQADFGVRNCGFEGARYTQSEANHLGWCRSVPSGYADAERQARAQEIEACKFCRVYLDKTLGQFEQKQRCLVPVGGPLWKSNPSYVHFNWCMEKPPGQNIRANPETFAATAQRDADLQACGQGPVLK